MTEKQKKMTRKVSVSFTNIPNTDGGEKRDDMDSSGRRTTLTGNSTGNSRESSNPKIRISSSGEKKEEKKAVGKPSATDRMDLKKTSLIETALKESAEKRPKISVTAHGSHREPQTTHNNAAQGCWAFLRTLWKKDANKNEKPENKLHSLGNSNVGTPIMSTGSRYGHSARISRGPSSQRTVTYHRPNSPTPRKSHRLSVVVEKPPQEGTGQKLRSSPRHPHTREADKFENTPQIDESLHRLAVTPSTFLVLKEFCCCSPQTQHYSDGYGR